MVNFEDYQKEEYHYIAEAHFKTIEAISSFFRYYLLLMSLPLSILGALSAMGSKSGQFESLLSNAKFLIPLVTVSVAVAFVGFCVMLYIVNLRMDVILYARTVNSIRKYFYDHSKLSVIEKLRLRVLPQTPFMPAYHERAYFWPVVFAFATFNSLYLFLGLRFLPVTSDGTWQFFSFRVTLLETIGITALFFILHFFAYMLYARHRETGYIRNAALGVDIDGVLNRHREHFCEMLKKKTGKNISPEQVVALPLHDDPTLGVSRDDERIVFNDPKYWSEMPPMEGASGTIKKIQNSFNMKVRFFTHRPWPDLKSRKIRIAWRDEARSILIEAYGCWMGRLFSIAMLFGWRPINAITIAWLHLNNFSHNGLLIERGNENLADPNASFANRFNMAKRKRIRFFVEDDWEKATKLAHICDVVFLINHPYNQKAAISRASVQQFDSDQQMPNNVVRTTVWDEIYKCVRRAV